MPNGDVHPRDTCPIGVTDYFVSVMTLGEAARMIDYAEDVDGWTSETPPELKMQRKLNVQRVEKEMVPYLVANEDHFYSALTVEVRTAARDRERGSNSSPPRSSQADRVRSVDAGRDRVAVRTRRAAPAEVD